MSKKEKEMGISRSCLNKPPSYEEAFYTGICFGKTCKNRTEISHYYCTEHTCIVDNCKNPVIAYLDENNNLGYEKVCHLHCKKDEFIFELCSICKKDGIVNLLHFSITDRKCNKCRKIVVSNCTKPKYIKSCCDLCFKLEKYKKHENRNYVYDIECDECFGKRRIREHS